MWPRDVVIEDKRVEILRGKGSKLRTVYFRSDELGILIERWKETRPKVLPDANERQVLRVALRSIISVIVFIFTKRV